jgi:hypothetical protein
MSERRLSQEPLTVEGVEKSTRVLLLGKHLRDAHLVRFSKELRTDLLHGLQG